MASLGRAVVYSLILVSLLCCFTEAKDFWVGGKDGWKVPSGVGEPLNRWAEASRFSVGDSLVWKIADAKDSALEVTREDYQSCNTSNPISSHNGSEAKVKLGRSGPFYFISGLKGNCEKGQRVIIVVLSPRAKGPSGTSPAPSPMEFDGPSIAPTSGASASAMMKGGFLGVVAVLVALVF
ncbi:hypothetical protein H6P81_000386 [Aristolochia fimbriata]|uniref:Phytocyanin domain-containing protein n=1 Tax=Aristolochia fimbriata TaxID=158543 RepID=A0AAV7F4F7_ARIFI|nr:hypothetical protein H6P81_000386 [Aristolochia fimbriata]